MSTAALLIRERNPDDDFVLRGGPAYYTDRTSFYPTNSDITTTTKKLTQHDYRADLYKDILQDDANLRSSLRNVSRSLRLVSNNIRKSLEEESTAKAYLPSKRGTVVFKDQDVTELNGHTGRPATAPQQERKWLADSEWNTSSGHHVSFTDHVPAATLLNRAPSMTIADMYSRRAGNEWDAEKLRRTVNVDMGMAEVPLTRFTRKDLMASEYFPITMSYSGSEASRTPRQSRSRTRSRDRLAKSARMRSMTPERTPVTDNFQSMKRLEKLYLVTSEAPATASARPSVLSPYQEDIAHLRMERLRLEEEHLKELNRLTTLERIRGPKPKWYELKDAQFHFEAEKNNDLIRTQNRWMSTLNAHSKALSQSQPDLRMCSAAFS